MKKNISKLLAVIIALSSVAMFAGCNNSQSSAASDTTEQASQTASTSTIKNDGNFDVESLQMYDKSSSDPFAGAWHITDGEGSKLDSFLYMFDGNGKAAIIVNNMGYTGTYSKTTDSTAEKAMGKSTFTCQLMFGINGVYTYEFSDSNNKVVLTNIESDKTTTMEKTEDINMVPTPDSNAEIDDNLAGAWRSDAGEYYYFSKDGIMYNNQYGTMFTYYKYSVKDGVITAVYTMDKETTETFNYEVTDDTLTIDDFTYNRISTGELDQYK